MRNINFNYLGIIMVFMMGFSSCENEPLPIDIPMDQVEFSATGTVDGQPFDFGDNIVMVTNTNSTGANKVYGGRLHGGCAGDNTSDCSTSLAISILDTGFVGANPAGYPIMLQPGELDIRFVDLIGVSNEEITVSAIAGDTFIIANFAPINPSDSVFEGHPFSYRPTARFPLFEPLSIIYYSEMDPFNIGSQVDVMLSLNNDDEIIYYYISPVCNQVSDSIIITFELLGNSPFTLNDFVVDSGSISLFDPIKISISSPFGGLPPIFISAINPATGNWLQSFYFFGPTDPSPSIICNKRFLIDLNSMPVHIESGLVSIEYVNQSGDIYTTDASSNGSANEFLILSTTPYVQDVFGNKTVVCDILFSAELTNPLTQETIFLENVELTFGFGY